MQASTCSPTCASRARGSPAMRSGFRSGGTVCSIRIIVEYIAVCTSDETVIPTNVRLLLWSCGVALPTVCFDVRLPGHSRCGSTCSESGPVGLIAESRSRVETVTRVLKSLHHIIVHVPSKQVLITSTVSRRQYTNHGQRSPAAHY